MQDYSALTAISPIDGRYQPKLKNLAGYFSEYALIRYRIHIEIEYFIALADAGFFTLSAAKRKQLRQWVASINEKQAYEVKTIERTTNHDVKAVEYFIKNNLETFRLGKWKEWVHFGLTSQDINNTALPLLWKNAIQEVYLPFTHSLIRQMEGMVTAYAAIPLLARTHGQPASPTRLGKEMMVFVERLQNQLKLFGTVPFAAKFGGATGNFNAHHVAFPKVNWKKFANHFVNVQLGLQRMQHTTQIEHYDSLAAHFDAMKRINTILIDFCRDIWTYISMDYFKQKIKAGEVGSSAMPHKVNPIDFENAEGNLGIANALWEHLAAKLPVSRLQRDLTDSTVLRNIGVPFAHTLLAFDSIQRGMSKLVVHEEKIISDLEGNWAVVAEAIQTILRRENYPNPYEALKELTRGANGIHQESIQAFIHSLKVKESIKKELLQITPHNYVGV
jgi:adenylosuccinate lyase